MEELEDGQEMKRILKVDLRGKNEFLWSKLRDKLIACIDKLLDTPFDERINSTVRDEFQNFKHSLLDYAKSKLAAPVLENQKTIAEVEMIYVEMEKEKAETRKIEAEAKKIEAETQGIKIDNMIKVIRISIGCAKVLVAGEKGEESILLIKNIEAFEEVLNTIQDSDPHMLR